MKKLIILTFLICSCSVNNTNGIQSPVISVNASNNNSELLKLLPPSPTNKLFIGNYEWSPDGKKMVVDINSNLFLINADGTEPKLIKSRIPLQSYRSIKWSPDKTKILLSTYNEYNLGLFSINIDGTGFVSFSNENGTRTEDAVWSPDGKKMAYTSRNIAGIMPNTLTYDPNIKISFYIINSDGTNKIELQSVRNIDYISSISWSNDGAKLAFIKNNILYTINADGTNLTQLVNPEPSKNYMNLYWSPDDSKIVFLSYEGRYLKMFSMNSDGTNLKNLSGTNNGDGNPIFSSDGKKILFISDLSVTSSKSISIMNIDGSNRQKLASNEGNYINARFAPDNKISYVIYVRSSNDGIESTKLYTMNIDGSDKKLIIGN